MLSDARTFVDMFRACGERIHVFGSSHSVRYVATGVVVPLIKHFVGSVAYLIHVNQSVRRAIRIDGACC